MSRQRTAIRKKVIDLIKSAQVVDEKSVSSNRFLRLKSDMLPVVVVYARDEKVEIYSESPRAYTRTVTLAVEVIQKAVNDSIDDWLDEACENIEKVMTRDYGLDGLSNDIVLTDVEMTMTDEGEMMIGAARMTWEIPYYAEATSISADEIIKLEDADRIHTDIESPITDFTSADSEDDVSLVEP